VPSHTGVFNCKSKIAAIKVRVSVFHGYFYRYKYLTRLHTASTDRHACMTLSGELRKRRLLTWVNKPNLPIYCIRFMMYPSKCPAAVRRAFNSQPNLVLIYRPWKDERFSWLERMRVNNLLVIISAGQVAPPVFEPANYRFRSRRSNHSATAPLNHLPQGIKKLPTNIRLVGRYPSKRHDSNTFSFSNNVQVRVNFNFDSLLSANNSNYKALLSLSIVFFQGSTTAYQPLLAQ
jgi:hypothetical protein